MASYISDSLVVAEYQGILYETTEPSIPPRTLSIDDLVNHVANLSCEKCPRVMLAQYCFTMMVYVVHVHTRVQSSNLLYLVHCHGFI